MTNIQWRDLHWYKILSYIISLGFFLFFSFSLFSERSYDLVNILLFGGISCFSLYLFFATLTTKLTYITQEGIRIGNATNDTYSRIIFSGSPFLEWNQIRKIYITNNVVRHGWVLFLRPFLIIKLKNGKTYKTFVARPRNFIKTLRELKKEDLLSKNSKYII